MNKIFKISCLSLFLSFSVLVGNNTFLRTHSYKQAHAESWSETINISQMGIKYAAAVNANANADYAVATSGKYQFGLRHGYLLYNTNEKFAYITGNGSTSCEYRTAEDDVSHAKAANWYLKTCNSDGCIFFITALDDMSISVTPSTVSTGWIDSTTYNNFYFRFNGTDTYHLISSTNNPAKNEATFAAFDAVNLSAGDTLYYEFVSTGTGSKDDSRRNIQSSYPTFNISGELVDVSVDDTVNSTTLIRQYASFYASHGGIEEVLSSNLGYTYGIRHGKLSNGAISQFSTITNSSSGTFSTGSDTEAGITSGKTIWSLNADGVILFFKALTDITFVSESITYAGGWADASVYVSYFLKRSGDSSFIQLSKQQVSSISVSGDKANFHILRLEAGDTIYFEFCCNATSGGRRSIQDNNDTGNVPTFTLKTENVNDAAANANRFNDDYMRMGSIAIDNQGTGACKNGLYSEAKTAFTSLNPEAKSLFCSNDSYASARERLAAWAVANNEVFNASNQTLGSNPIIVFENKEQHNYMTIAVVIFASISTLLCFFLVSKKKKAE